MKRLRNILLSVATALIGIPATAQELSLPTDPQPESLDFIQRTLVVQFTGTGCPACPYTIRAIEELLADEEYNNKFCLAVSHGYNTDDPMYLDPDFTYRIYLPLAYPRTCVGFTEKIGANSTSTVVSNLKKAIDKCLTREVNVGLAVNSKLTGDTLTIKAELKAAQTGEYTIGCWMVEDSIYAFQAGGLSYMTHNNAVRISQDTYGKDLGLVEVGKTANTEYTLTFQDGWIKKNCHLIIYSCLKQDGEYIITNAITAPLNTEIPYEYKSPNAIGEIEGSSDFQIIYHNNHVKVTATSPIENLTIYNLHGQPILQLSPRTESATVSLEDLPSGIYIVHTGNTKILKTQKIIKL